MKNPRHKKALYPTLFAAYNMCRVCMNYSSFFFITQAYILALHHYIFEKPL